MCPVSLCHISLSCLWGPEPHTWKGLGQMAHTGSITQAWGQGFLVTAYLHSPECSDERLAYIVPEIYANAAA